MDRRDFIKKAGVSAMAMAIGSNLQYVSAAETPEENKNTANNNNKTEMKHKCKITVLKRECYKDLQEQYLADPKSGPCPYFHEGQEIMVDSDNFFHMLDGKFCSEAWDCISRYVYSALQGGSIMRGWTNDEKMMITCCNDGTRPVIFKLERIDENGE
ncbi:MAG: TIGR04076 family protein [Prevotellaceae bacterium]|nr:TIGR04076 family protein [Prevotellaceae bacterium]